MYPSDAVFAGIGKVVVAWALLEHNFASFTISMISTDIDTGISLTKELRFRSLCDAILNVFRSHIGEGAEFDELAAIVNRAEQLALQRNKLAHTPVFANETDLEKAHLWKVTAKRKGIKRVMEPVSASELEALAQEIRDLQRTLMDLFKRLVMANRFKYVKPA
jgi:hypothetical protein